MRISLLFRRPTIKLVVFLAACVSQLGSGLPLLADPLSNSSSSAPNTTAPLRQAIGPTQAQSPSSQAAPPATPSAQDDSSAQPDSDARHDINKTLDMDKLRLHSAVHKYSFE